MKLVVDLAVTVNKEKIILIKRAKEPFTDKLVLPGGHFEETDKSLAHACAREAKEEINLTVKPEELEMLAILDGPGRDPRPERRISIVYTINITKERVKDLRAGSDAKAIRLELIKKIKKEQIGFDHWKIIKMLK